MRRSPFIATLAMAAATLGTRDARAIEGGAEDRTTTHAVAISVGPPSAPDVRCTGTLISTNVVLTVWHCLTDVAPATRDCDAELGAIDERVRDMWITASPFAESGGAWHRTARAVVPEPTKICGNDVALLVLEEDVGASEATPARPLTSVAGFREAIAARQLGLAGFGATSIHASDAGIRRARHDVPIRCVPGEPGFACGPELDYIDVREFTAGAGPCRGDSGAAAMTAGDRGIVFGVLSRGNLGTSCAEGVFERTDVWAWLLARTVIDATAAGAAAPAWASELFPAAPRAGEMCRGAGACGESAECVSLDGRRSFVCAERCVDGACASGLRCESGVCIAAQPGEDVAPLEPGCRAAGVAARGGAMPALALALLWLAWRRRRAGSERIVAIDRAGLARRRRRVRRRGRRTCGRVRRLRGRARRARRARRAP